MAGNIARLSPFVCAPLLLRTHRCFRLLTTTTRAQARHGLCAERVDELAAMTNAASTYQLSRKNPDDGLQCTIVCGLNLPMLVLIIEGVSRKRAYGSDPSTDGSLALMSDYLAFGLSMFSSLCPLIRQNFLPRQSDVLKDTSDICDMAITITDPNPAVNNI